MTSEKSQLKRGRVRPDVLFHWLGSCRLTLFPAAIARRGSRAQEASPVRAQSLTPWPQCAPEAGCAAVPSHAQGLYRERRIQRRHRDPSEQGLERCFSTGRHPHSSADRRRRQWPVFTTARHPALLAVCVPAQQQPVLCRGRRRGRGCLGLSGAARRTIGRRARLAPPLSLPSPIYKSGEDFR